uniref:Uncharacterized protein n=1 Tax=Nelumbo nucifera TaxID=4432 RepID=A0A822Y160_NELNU|nr:TPA_asm: hypothetical protein HUJ06_029112 [Nelumbo nucifera]
MFTGSDELTHANAKFARDLIKILQDGGQVVSLALATMARSSGSHGGGLGGELPLKGMGRWWFRQSSFDF